MTQRDDMGRVVGGGSGLGTHVHPWRIHVNLKKKKKKESEEELKCLVMNVKEESEKVGCNHHFGAPPK